MKILNKLAASFDAAVNIAATAAGGFAIFVMLLIVIEIVLRMANIPLLWAFETTEYVLLYITFLGAAWVLKRDRHVRMDLIIKGLDPKSRSWLNFATSIIGATICLVLTYYGAKVTFDTFVSKYFLYTEVEPPAWPIIVVIPVGGFLLFIQFLRMTYGYLRTLKGANNMSKS